MVETNTVLSALYVSLPAAFFLDWSLNCISSLTSPSISRSFIVQSKHKMRSTPPSFFAVITLSMLALSFANLLASSKHLRSELPRDVDGDTPLNNAQCFHRGLPPGKPTRTYDPKRHVLREPSSSTFGPDSPHTTNQPEPRASLLPGVPVSGYIAAVVDGVIQCYLNLDGITNDCVPLTSADTFTYTPSTTGSLATGGAVSIARGTVTSAGLLLPPLPGCL